MMIFATRSHGMRTEEQIKTIKDLGIIGGGAAGLFAACFAKERGLSFEVLEKTGSCGSKLLLTGGGRCNILNLKTPMELKSCYHGKDNFIYPALAHYPPQKAYAFIEKVLGVDLIEEENNRIFPASGKSRQILDALLGYTGSENIRSKTSVTKLLREEESGIWQVTADTGDVFCYRNIILAAGGMSYPKTGSSGESYKLAKDLGHKIVPPVAALAPVKIRARDEIGVPAGLTVKSCIVKILDGDKTLRKTEGDVLFTHEGLSGPAVMELARDIREGVKISIDLAPVLEDKHLTRDIAASPARRFTNILSSYIPQSLADHIVTASGASQYINASEVTKDIRRKALRMIRGFTVEALSDPDIRTAYVTAGGVDISSVDRKTMGSKICPGLYFAGEFLDFDGISGGYNLTACIAQARLAVDSVRI